jgi:Ni/Co efflux regulator RcnB
MTAPTKETPMRQTHSRRRTPLLLATLIACGALFAATPALADKGGKHGHGRDAHEERGNRQDERDYRDYRDDRRHGHEDRDNHHDYRFDNNQRDIIGIYFGDQSRAGKCPPGLAKKHNGCLPPGQARKWQVGQPLPRDLQRYPLPRDLLGRLPPPPRGHEYVRVASDVLLITVGTGMVLDAIEDLGRR